MSLKSLKDVYIGQLKDMYSAEKQAFKAMLKVIDAVSNPDLKAVFHEHRAQTEVQMETVRALLDELDENPTSTKCKAMEGLIEEVTEIVNGNGSQDARDAALIVAAQKIEHYEMASYGGLVTFARTLGYEKAARELQNILDQEYDADQKLDNVAMGVHNNIGVNVAAMN